VSRGGTSHLTDADSSKYPNSSLELCEAGSFAVEALFLDEFVFLLDFKMPRIPRMAIKILGIRGMIFLE
jgi:hypothetical protein